MKSAGWLLLLAACAPAPAIDLPPPPPPADVLIEDSGTAVDSGSPVPDAGVATPDAGTAFDGGAIVAERPYRLHVPPNLDKTKPLPLVVLFHGYGSDSVQQDAYFGLSNLADQKGFLLALPDGTRNSTGLRFWNATDGCCNFYKQSVDDVLYFRAIVADVQSRYAVDPRRVFVVGHSNGAFMSHRLACEASEQIAAIVSLAGAQWKDPAKCQPSKPVAILEVHGDADATIHYDGGVVDDPIGPPGGPYPSARETVAQWAVLEGCSGALAPTGTRKDLVWTLGGSETRVEAYAGCAVELWTIEGGPHVPAFGSEWGPAIWQFLSAHAKP
jgi:polyhydroxybutyrate depolymerase